MNPFTTTWYKEQCESLRIHPEKQRGQHFLIDQSVLNKMIESARLTATDTVIEIGPGFGPLTNALAQTQADIHTYDVEKKFAQTPIMNELIASGRINFHLEDILEVDETLLPRRYVIIANLPYNISSATIIKFLTSTHPPSRMILMLQKEVVEKLIARPPHMTRLTVLAQATSSPKKICAVPRTAFWPQPKVDSAVIELPDISQPKHFDALQKLTRIGFASKRKKLVNNLKSLIPQADSALEQADINSHARAEEISVDQWLALAALT